MPRATSLAARIKDQLPGAEIELARGGKGDFIVTADGVTLWDKRKTGNFPDEVKLVSALLDCVA